MTSVTISHQICQIQYIFFFLDDQCSFDGQFFEVGEELSTDNPCVKCKCIAAPDLTCIHQTCSLSPNEENCQAIYTLGECCPSYECMLGDTEAHPGNFNFFIHMNLV